MQHNNHDKKETWYKDGYKSCFARQTEMLRRHYSEYNESDWVLWIVPDFYHQYPADIIGSIQINKKDGEVLAVPHVVRTPYPNKRLNQLSMKSGRKRLYGIPLVFKAFEELCNVKEVVIKWNIYEQWYLKEGEAPLDAHVKNVIVKYELSFEKDPLEPSHRFFTVFSKDSTFDETKAAKRTSYYDEFDMALCIEGVLEYHCTPQESVTPSIAEIFVLNEETEGERLLTEKEAESIEQLRHIEQDKTMLQKITQDTVVKTELQWGAYIYEKTETLKASYMADFVPAQCFGFMESSSIREP